MLYRSVLQTFGADTAPFALIAQAEARHVEALQMLFTRRQMAPPASIWAPGSFPPFASIPDACAAGVTAEKEDAAFYTPYLQPRRPAAGRPQCPHEPAEGLAREPPPRLRALPVGDAMTRNAPARSSRGRGRSTGRSSPARDGLSSCS